MKHPLWERLPNELRSRVDELIADDRKLPAIVAIRDTLDQARPGIFNGEVPPWPEALEANATGRALANRLGVPFHFASPDNPNSDLPRWWTGKA